MIAKNIGLGEFNMHYLLLFYDANLKKKIRLDIEFLSELKTQNLKLFY
jgi:hypothetical protein